MKKKPAELYVIHNYGDVEPSIINRKNPCKSRAEALQTVAAHLLTENSDPEGGYYLLTVMNGKPEIDAFTGGEMDEARGEG